ncbi:tetratricopeptide repeat protein [Pseudomonas sp. A-RE-19]|uniref:tetratricopeptide repeat protein n=1 Tax=Pseudomonas sp. A-RE-19 TaxID=2832401 RepID=UPI001CBCCEF5|nr:tetratricopeptide repeat protein [Pseudomonas sp. A-RE-19]
MSFQLRREEVLDGDHLKTMLNESPARAAQAILIAAREGVLDAQALLGQILLDGRGIEQDQPLAVRWFEIAAQHGHLMARNMLGRCHEHGWGSPADVAIAARHYRIAAEAGLDWAMYNLANLLATGRGVIGDQAQALTLYRRAAELGHAKSMNLLGRYLEEGSICSVDSMAAHDWYRRSAEAGDFRGQFSYASILVDQTRMAEGLAWYRRAMLGGNLAFLKVATQTLMSSTDPRVQALAGEYQLRSQLLSNSLSVHVA